MTRSPNPVPSVTKPPQSLNPCFLLQGLPAPPAAVAIAAEGDSDMEDEYQELGSGAATRGGGRDSLAGAAGRLGGGGGDEDEEEEEEEGEEGVEPAPPAAEGAEAAAASDAAMSDLDYLRARMSKWEESEEEEEEEGEWDVRGGAHERVGRERGGGGG